MINNFLANSRPHALIINFFLLFSTRTLARRSTYIRLSKIFVQGPNSHVHSYFNNPQLYRAWSVSPQRWPTSFVHMPDYPLKQCLLYGCLACPGVELKLPFWAYRQWFESEVERSFHWGPKARRDPLSGKSGIWRIQRYLVQLLSSAHIDVEQSHRSCIPL